ncbi:ABC transporter substrate-binding protein [Cupriavidus basilensis]|uniref:ABC transporter substrate-binding protein n=1 Tax=Cupriavidus basilensis TaxID=68895 RepID=UPI0023E76EB2|nr:ABC transporter substrate-binding protein [Cupriavidus basilensis]MDF3887396.1 ABC transporter substrate-binding protein [Cupriavidus basilensis]
MKKEMEGGTVHRKHSAGRRATLRGLVALGASTVGVQSIRPASAAARTLKIGYVSPRTGPLAPFAETDGFILQRVRAAIANGISVAGNVHPVLIIEKDSQSNPNRAAEVTASLIKDDKVDLIVSACTADTVNPVSDQCELGRIPCITTNCPWQPYYFGRGGSPAKGFEYTYHFCWGLEDLIAVYTAIWDSAGAATNRTVGALWPNDAEGNAFSDKAFGFPPALAANGYKLVDLGRFQPTANDFSAQIRAFKAAKVEIVTGVLPPAAFATFWSQAAQQGFKPKIVTFAKALLFPSAVAGLGPRGVGLSTEVAWSPAYPYRSTLTGETSAQFAAAYEAATGRQWVQPLGATLSLFEVALDVLKRSAALTPQAIVTSIRATDYASAVGPVKWTGSPVKNVTKTPLVGAQWTAGNRHPLDLQIVSATLAKDIGVQKRLAILT